MICKLLDPSSRKTFSKGPGLCFSLSSFSGHKFDAAFIDFFLLDKWSSETLLAFLFSLSFDRSVGKFTQNIQLKIFLDIRKFEFSDESGVGAGVGFGGEKVNTWECSDENYRQRKALEGIILSHIISNSQHHVNYTRSENQDVLLRWKSYLALNLFAYVINSSLYLFILLMNSSVSIQLLLMRAWLYAETIVSSHLFMYREFWCNNLSTKHEEEWALNQILRFLIEAALID